MNKQKIYLLYICNYNGMAENNEPAEIIGAYKTIEEARERMQQEINDNLKNDFILDKKENNIYNNYITMFYKYQNNWQMRFDIYIKELEI